MLQSPSASNKDDFGPGDAADAVTAAQATLILTQAHLNLTAIQATEFGRYVEGLAWAGRVFSAVDIATVNASDRGYKIADTAIGEVAGRYGGAWGLLGSFAFDQIGGTKTVVQAAKLQGQLDVLNDLDAQCHGTSNPTPPGL